MSAEPTPWVQGNVSVPRRVIDELTAEAVAAYGRDEEACGYLVGPASEPLLADAAQRETIQAETDQALDDVRSRVGAVEQAARG